MELSFDCQGNAKQYQCVEYWNDSSTIEMAYGGSKGSGKSFLGCNLIFADAFIYPNTQYFIARAKLNDLRRFTRPSIHEVFDIWGVTDKYYTYNGQDNCYNLYNGSTVFLLDAKYLPSDPLYKRFGSMQMTRGWIEEAGEFVKDAKSNLQASIGRWKNDVYNLPAKLLQTCNPSKNYLYKDYYKPYREGVLPDHMKFIQALPQDNKMLPDGYIENLHKILTGSEKQRLLFGNWEYDDSPDALCEYEAIVGIFHNDHVPSGEMYLVCDVARYGSDKAIVSVWDGMNLIQLDSYEKSSTVMLQRHINELRNKYGIPKRRCIADDDGVGGGVVDNCGILGFVNNSKALKDENYQNLKTQCEYELASAVNNGEINISCQLSEKDKEEIIEELEWLKSYNSDKEGKKQSLPKDQIKKKIGRSPDKRDVLTMRMYFELKPSRRLVSGMAFTIKA